MRRRYGYYWAKLIGAVVVLGIWTVAFVWLGDTWWQLASAAVLSVLLTQTAFLGHDAAHRQIFRSGKWNDWISLIIANLLVGISYGWWQSKHTRHHAKPNQEGADPDIDLAVIAFTPAQVDRRRNVVTRWLVGKQGWFFFPILLFEGVSLHADAYAGSSARGTSGAAGPRSRSSWCRLGGLITLILIVLPPEKAVVFLVVQLAVFGFYMGATFAPNHIGMPLVPAEAQARLPPPPGPDEPQYQRRPLGVDPVWAGSTIRSSTTCFPPCHGRT